MREEGLDCRSPYEVQLALDCGYIPEQILFTGNNTGPRIRFLCRKRSSANIGSLLTLEHFGKRYSGQNISLRVNPELVLGIMLTATGGPRSKFGIYHDQLEQAQELAQRHSLRIVGIRPHHFFAPEPMLDDGDDPCARRTLH